MGGPAGWLEVGLIVLGLGCLGLEIFVIPGFGVFGVSGILLVIASLVMAGHSWTFDLATNIEELTWQTGQVMLSLGIVLGLGIAIARFLPSVPGFDSMVLGPPGSGMNEPRLRLPESIPEREFGDSVTIGDLGTAVTMLRPSGKARFSDRVVDVISEGPFILGNARLEIVAVTGNRIVVREV